MRKGGRGAPGLAARRLGCAEQNSGVPTVNADERHGAAAATGCLQPMAQRANTVGGRIGGGRRITARGAAGAIAACLAAFH